MSSEAISFYLSTRLGTGCFPFYYDFHNWSTAGGNYILTTGSDQYPTRTRYSGNVEGNFDAFTGTVSGSGAFSENYIKVQNVDSESGDLIPTVGTQGFTFLVSQAKIDNSCGTIFSNFGGFNPNTTCSIGGCVENCASGWEFGINNANQLYFRFQDAEIDGTPRNNITTLNIIPSAKNFYGVTLQDNQLQLARYIPKDNDWETASRRINPSYIRNSNDWYIGSGEYNYSGYMDHFAFFNRAIPLTDLTNVVHALYQGIETGVGFSTSDISGDITGYDFYATGETGVIATTGVPSGTIPSTGSGVYLTGIPLTGQVNEGELYFLPSTTFTGAGNPAHQQSGVFYSTVVATNTLERRITGFGDGFFNFDSDSSLQLISGSGITGVLWTGSGANPLYAPSTTEVLNSGVSILTGQVFINPDSSYDFSYLNNTLSYMAERGRGKNVLDPGDFVEYPGTGDFFEIISTHDELINLFPSYGFSRTLARETFYVDQEYRAEDIFFNLFSNGVFQVTGTMVEQRVAPPGTPTSFKEACANYRNTLNPNAPSFAVASGNYCLRAVSVKSTAPYMERSDEVIYDARQSGAVQPQSGRLEISGLDQYGEWPFTSIPMPFFSFYNPASPQIFFNGQKIYTLVDYINRGGFTPTGEITGMTGTYVARPGYTDVKGYGTGINLYDFSGLVDGRTSPGQGFSGDTKDFVYYVNGVRAAPSAFIAYCTGVSLLTTGKNVLELPLEMYYNLTTSL